MISIAKLGLHLRTSSYGYVALTSRWRHIIKSFFTRKRVFVSYVKGNFDFKMIDINLSNWKDQPFSHWSFQHVDSLIPIEKIRGSSRVKLPLNIDSNFLSRKFKLNGSIETVAEFLDRSDTDAFVVLKKGEIVSEWYANGMNLHSPHLIFSISKSITGILAGIILEKYNIDPERKVSSFFKQAVSGAYATATIRNLLDMNVSLDFDETYTSTTGKYARYRQAMLWMDRDSESQQDENLEDFILSLEQGENRHGHAFNYRSPNSDLLGRILEVIANKPLAKLLRDEIWMPLGCENATITVDAKRMARTAGGISCSIHDLAVVSEALRKKSAPITSAWLQDTIQNGDKQAWQRGDFANFIKDASYRNQWYIMAKNRIAAIGIHGQWIYIDLSNDLVVIRLSSQAAADDDSLDTATIDLLKAISAST